MSTSEMQSCWLDKPLLKSCENSPNQVLTHAARAAAYAAFQPLCGSARSEGSGQSKSRKGTRGGQGIAIFSEIFDLLIKVLSNR